MEFDIDYYTVKLISFVLSLIYTFLTIVVTAAFIIYIDRRLLTKIHIQTQLQKGNIAVAVFASSLLILIILILFIGLV
jgi:hypothetical protein